MAKLLEFQISGGVTGVVPAGTTGESPTFDHTEQCHLCMDIAKYLEGRGVFLLPGTGSNNTREARHFTGHVCNHGADGVLDWDCYYNRPTSRMLRTLYYKPLCEVVKDRRSPSGNQIVLIPYVIPCRTGTKLLPADLAILSREYPTIVVGMKDATGDLEYAKEVRRQCGDQFTIWSGDDGTLRCWMTNHDVKAHGVISVVSNIAPAAMVAFVNAVANGRAKEADRLGEALQPLFDVVTIDVGGERFPNPVPIKTIMAALGMCPSVLRPPLGFMSAAGVAVAREALRRCWHIDRTILAPIEQHWSIDVWGRINDDSIWEALTDTD